MRLAPALGALAACAACSGAWWMETDRAYGVALDTREASDPAAIPAAIVACGAELDALLGEGEGGRVVDGARVRYAVDVGEACPSSAAACYVPSADLVVVNSDGDALCHEMKHRARAARGLSLDYDHDEPGWWAETPHDEAP